MDTDLHSRGPSRRQMLKAVALTSAVTSSGAVLLAPAAPAAAADFNFDTGNAAKELLNRGGAGLAGIDPMDATILIRLTCLLANAWFDAIAPYHRSAVGVYSKLGRRPVSESATHRQRNIALLYASNKVLGAFPLFTAQSRAVLSQVGLDPDDDQENTTTPIGIGNLAGKGILANKLNDGMNQLGYGGGRKYNPQPFADTTGYRPVNTAYELSHPSRWQPNVLAKQVELGTYQIQQFVTPQFGGTKAYTFRDPARFLLPPPRKSDYTHNRAAYRAQADEILSASAALTDELKMKVELFADKRVLGASTAATAVGLDFDAYFHYYLTTNIAAYDAAIAAWYNKLHHDSVRPFSAIRFLYGGSPVTAWGGPGKGTVHDIPGRDWCSYVNTPDHPEYPSGSTALCGAHAQAARRFRGTDAMSFSQTYAAGSSQIEPGITPAKDLTLSWSNWSTFDHDCGMSRLWGGAHFRSSIEASRQMSPRIGDLAYEFVQRHVRGEAT
ncbi:DUF6851 domain-containing protein [Actinomadura fibrosa]|uniref:DUF6851 domain-containing protein n=1 Tax=Actinomadura fibrosa TaxID=111802 RepID=A0ABW2XSP6_9ACTN|nr:hypothetical protein [Actinomadura fibrosa]